jgi:integrase
MKGPGEERVFPSKIGIKWEKTRYQGVYFRVSEGRRVQNGKPDKCFFIRYKKDGLRVMEKVGWGGDGYTAETAIKIRGERIRTIWHGEELPKDKEKPPTFSQMAEAYLKWAEENKASFKDDKGRYNNHLKDLFGNKRLSEITPLDLERLKSDLTKKELGPGTIKQCLALVRQIFNKALDWGKYKGANPIRGVKLPTLNNGRERFLSKEEATLLLKELWKVSKSVHDQALIALHCGLRAGEIFSLRGRDLDFKNGLIRIMDPKNKTNRTAFMTETVKEMLKQRLPENLNDLIFSDWWHGEEIKLVSRTFARTVEKLGFNAGIDDPRQKVVFHTLRHTFASWLAIQGTPVLTIKELLGHKSLAMTERYAHLIPDVKREAIGMLERNFNGGNGKSLNYLP